MTPLDDIFREDDKPTIQQIEEKRLRVAFEWVMSFSVLVWAIAIVSHFGNDISLLLKGVLLIGLSTIIVSSILSLCLAFFDYKNFSFYTRFYHLWLLLMILINGGTSLAALYFIL
jgi:hypothetical protein